MKAYVEQANKFVDDIGITPWQAAWEHTVPLHSVKQRRRAYDFQFTSVVSSTSVAVVDEVRPQSAGRISAMVNAIGAHTSVLGVGFDFRFFKPFSAILCFTHTLRRFVLPN